VSRVRAGLAFAALVALVMAGGPGASASGASSPSPAPSSGKAAAAQTSPVEGSTGRARRVAAEQSGAVSAGRTLGLGAGERLIVKDVITDPDGSTHVRYDRTFDGLRVIGGDLVSHRVRSGKIAGVSWNGARRVAVASTRPTVSAVAAGGVGTRKARLAHESTISSRGELVVYSGGPTVKAAPRLAYDVLTVGVRPDQTPSRLHTIVDATTGATLKSWDEIENATGTGSGTGIYDGTVPLVTTVGPPWSLRDAAGNYITDLNGVADTTGTVSGTTFTDTDNIWGNGTVSDRASAAVDAQYGAEQTFDFFKNVLGRNGIWNNGIGARSRVHYGTDYQNAFWDGTQMTYGDGASNTHALVELDVAGHEMSHGVTENTAGLVGTGEAGGLNEATSDIFGTSVEFNANNPADVPDYLIGEKVNLNGDGSPLRYLDRPSRDGVSPDCWSSTLAGLDAHYAAGPLDHWFYLASEGSGIKTINGVSYNSPTCNASTVTPIGRDAAVKIWYRTLTTYLTSGDSYAAARDGAIESAKDLYGAASTQCTGIAASFSAIGVPAGAVSCGIPTPPPPGSNLLSNPGFESGDTLWASTPSVIAQWGTTTPPQPAHTGTWSAWLGGYGVVHSDSVSQLVTIPAGSSASLSYYVHIDTNESATPPAFDTLAVRAGSTTLQTLSNLDAANGYQLKTVDLSAYLGQTISLSFTSAEDSSAATSFVVDDTSLTATSSATAPGAPTGVSGLPGNGQAAVSWTAPASNGGSAITGYTVTASPGGATAATSGATSTTVAGLTDGTAYTFTVTATNALGTSAASPPSTAVTPRAIPGAPTAVLATAGNGQASVSWTAPASNGGSAITGYTVTASPGGLSAATSGATSTTVAGLTNGTGYTFTVTATNAAGTSAASVASSAVTPTTVPGAPTAVVATAGNGQASVSWTAPASNGGALVSGYIVTASRGGLTAATSGATSATVAGLANGTAYTFTVTATNVAGTSAASAASPAVTPRTVPGAPTGVVAASGNGQASVSWTSPGGNGGSAVTGYTVTSSPGGLTAATSGATSATVAGLTNGTAYTFTVTATNAAGPGPGSVASNSVTPVATAAVTRLSDFNRDGFTDLVARDTAGVLWLYPGNGAGGFRSRVQMGSGWNIMTALVTPGDVTGDTYADVLGRDGAGALWLYPGNGAGGFGARRQIGSGWTGYTITNAADLNGGGRPDILARDPAGVLWLYPITGNAVIGTRVMVASGWGAMTSILGSGDVTGDGRADITGRDAAGGLWLYRGNGVGAIATGTLFSSGWQSMTALITPGNWDRAAGNDLLVRDAAGVLWAFPGDNAGSYGSPRQIGSGWNIMTYIG